jgi:carbohydrate-binding DOMON domain-containing protein
LPHNDTGTDTGTDTKTNTKTNTGTDTETNNHDSCAHTSSSLHAKGRRKI